MTGETRAAGFNLLSLVGSGALEAAARLLDLTGRFGIPRSLPLGMYSSYLDTSGPSCSMLRGVSN